jgi:hypothetical protein
MTKTIGISPKVWVPALGQVAVGIAFLLLGLDVEGKTAIATGLGTAAVGFRAPNSPVVTVGTEDPVDPDVTRSVNVGSTRG